MYCNSVESAKAPDCNKLWRSECNPRTNAYFIAFVIGEHAVLKNWLIHLAIYTKTTKCYSLILMVLCTVWLPVTTTSCSDSYANFLWGTGFAFCFDIWRIIDQCSPNYSKKWNGKINGRIHVAQVCLRLAGVCNETVDITVRQHWSGRRLQLIKTEHHSHSLKSIFSSWSSPKMIEVGLKFRRNHHLRCKHQIVYIPLHRHLKECWLQ